MEILQENIAYFAVSNIVIQQKEQNKTIHHSQLRVNIPALNLFPWMLHYDQPV